MIGLDGNTKGQCVRTVDNISDPTDIDGKNQRGTERRSKTTEIQRISGSWTEVRYPHTYVWCTLRRQHNVYLKEDSAEGLSRSSRLS